jgi:hypothetical protein
MDRELEPVAIGAITGVRSLWHREFDEFMVIWRSGLAHCKRMVAAATRSLCQVACDLQNRYLPDTPQSTMRTRILVYSNNLDTQLALRVAAFSEDWQLTFASSAGHALELLRSMRLSALVYDYDCGEGEWRTVCGESAKRGICFHVVARRLPDELFLSVVSAGGCSILSKPLTSNQVTSAIYSTLSLRHSSFSGAAKSAG